jgi:seryl-tRNA synthetase
MSRALMVSVAGLRDASAPALEGLRADLAFCHPKLLAVDSIDAAAGMIVAQIAPRAPAEEIAAAVAEVARASLHSYELVPASPPLWQRSPASPGPGLAAVGAFIERYVRVLGPGQYALVGPAARLRTFLDQRFEKIALALDAEPWHLPSVEVTEDLIRRTGYLGSHPQHVTFGYRLPPHHEELRSFAADVTEGQLAWPAGHHRLDPTGFILAPVVCHNILRALRGARLPGAVHITALGTCYRYEGFRFAPLLRQWEFSMRELVLLGTHDEVRAGRERAVALTRSLADELDLPARLEIATDPFFVASAASPRTFQALQATKLELRLGLEGDETTAGASFNLHGKHFSEPMAITEANGGEAETACVGWGLERWMAAFVARWSADPARWPLGR